MPTLTNLAIRKKEAEPLEPASSLVIRKAIKLTTATLYLNGSSQTISVAPDGSFSKMVTLTAGANTIEVRAADAAGNTGTSGVVSVTLDSTAPQLTIGLSDPTDAVNITVTSNEALIAAPIVVVNPAITMTQEDVNKWTGIYGSADDPVAVGAYTVTVNGTDKAGNKTTKTATFSKQQIDVDGVDPTTVSTSTTTLEIETNGAVNNADISLTSTMQNPSGNVGNPEGAGNAAGAFVEIVASPELRDNLKEICIRVDYDPDELPAGTDESTLKLYLWDAASGTWKVVPGSGVNTDEHYIYGCVTHLSKYGGFATAVAAPPPPPPGGGAGAAKDTKPPKFSNIRAEDVTETSATIRWKTDERGTSQVEYWSSPGKLSPLDGAFVYDHAVYLTDLHPATTYNYKVMSEDRSGNKAVSDEYTFTTLGEPAAFTVGDLSISPTEVGIGQPVTISVIVINTGDFAGSYKVTLKMDNIVVDTEEVTVAGGGSQKVSFTTSRDAAGTYSVAVDGLSGTFIVKVPPPPKPMINWWLIGGIIAGVIIIGIIISLVAGRRKV